MTTATREQERDAHPAGVWRALAIVAVVACFVWIPYAIEQVPMPFGMDPIPAEHFQVVGPDDEIPLSDLLTADPRQGGASLAGALRRQTLLEEDDEALMEAAPLPEAVEVQPQRSRRRPPRRGEEDRQQTPLPRVDPEEYAGLTQPIEDPHGSMRAFYRQLGRVQRDRPVLARMGVYGTSTNGADRMTEQLRVLLQRRFGDGGKGWVPVAPGWRYQRHQNVSWSHDHWRTYVVNRSDGPLDRYGFGGVLAINRHRGAFSTIGTAEDEPAGNRVSVFRVFHQAWPGGGRLSLQVDDEEPRIVDTGAQTVEDRVETVEVPDGPHALTLTPVAGEDEEASENLRLYGVVLERDGPGVVVDGLMLIGAFTRVLRLFAPEHLETQIQQRDPNLLVFWMGANDAVSETMPFIPDQYREHYRGILRRYQDAQPEMSCMVMSILDKGERVRGRIRTRERVPRLVAIQREIAHAEGCAFFDTYEALGGRGTMRRWYGNSPRLVTADLGHLTAAGSRILGTLLYRALMKGYDDWIADGEPAPGEQ
ncbi:MAG TPA: GDSL-type esterase/lipase family protein [Sandaracinaceae bacterium LLY-WYZ-13_1]|nr:GDSL-type esterase/lipase family protein [Sandaracinaceae bacterium LLY-WYZ-13_1]